MIIEITVTIVSILLIVYLCIRNNYKLLKCIINKKSSPNIPIVTTSISLSNIDMKFQTSVMNNILTSLTPNIVGGITNIASFIELNITDSIKYIKSTITDPTLIPSPGKLNMIVNNLNRDLLPIITNIIKTLKE